MIFLDTNALAKLYVAEEETAKLEAFVTGQNDPIPFSSIHELELTSAFERRVGAGEMTAAARDQVLSTIEKDLGSGVLSRVEINWSSVLVDLIQLVRKHGARHGLRALDAMHLDSAQFLGASVFITYDIRQAHAARSEGMRIESPA